ncbi:MAG TPA: hypothetical protein VNS22_08200 [Geminicoccus sp.]|uniref:hypothetical protein n=1 Tax=Geminicoccus sp. TaxID=2024832 RepID=UPI002C6906CB|nr:hypothetical protein [Geminicoccus sp.]HWL68353.1 hypothetical protein [Geminicoccus sp.]
MAPSHTISELTRQRATLAGDILKLEDDLARLRTMLTHIDAVITYLDPTADPTGIKPRQRGRKPIVPDLFRYTLEVLRTADDPLTAWEISKAVIAKLGMEERMVNRVERSVSPYLKRKEGELVRRVPGDNRIVRWELI